MRAWLAKYSDDLRHVTSWVVAALLMMAVLAAIDTLLPHSYNPRTKTPCDFNAMNVEGNFVAQAWRDKDWYKLFDRAQRVADIATVCSHESKGQDRLKLLFGRGLAFEMMAVAEVETDRVRDGKAYFRLAQGDFKDATFASDVSVNSEAKRNQEDVERLLASPDLKKALRNPFGR